MGYLADGPQKADRVEEKPDPEEDIGVAHCHGDPSLAGGELSLRQRGITS